MNGMQVFQNNEFGELGVLEIDGKAYFPATACARKLGYGNPKQAIIDHCKGVTKRDLLTNGGVQAVNLIPEGDLYRLITHSKLPTAERFERWVFDDVLPSIRRGGYYAGDISAIVARVVREAVPEAIRATIAGLREGGYKDVPPREAEPSQKKRIVRTHSIIGELDTPVRQELEDIILEGRMTYVEISEHFRELYDVNVSKSSIGRHAARLYASIENVSTQIGK